MIGVIKHHLKRPIYSIVLGHLLVYNTSPGHKMTDYIYIVSVNLCKEIAVDKQNGMAKFSI